MAQRQPQIVAMGGGGFSMEPDNPLLDDYVLGLTGKDRPRVCFVPTASGDSPTYIEKFYAAFGPDRAAATHLRLFVRGAADPRDIFLEQDVIYVGGGNTANMLQIWRTHGVDEALRAAWEAGVILTGLSAGANCWFESSVTDSFGPLAVLRDGLGLLGGSCCPHYDGEAERRPAYWRMVSAGELPAGVAIDDGAAIHYIGIEQAAVVSSRPQARAYRLEARDGEAVETVLEVRHLGGRDGGCESYPPAEAGGAH